MPSARSMKKKNGYRYVPEKPLIAIVIDQVDGKPVGRSYHTQDLPRAIRKFESDMRRLYPSAEYINYYSKGAFLRRSYLVEKKSVPCYGKVKRDRLFFKNYGDDVMRCMMENSLH